MAVILAGLIVSEAVSGLQAVGVGLTIVGVVILKLVGGHEDDAPVEVPAKR